MKTTFLKTAFLFIFFAIATLTACKKSSKKETAPTAPLTSSELLGRITWNTILSRHTYLDANNNRLYKTNDSTGVRYDFSNGQVKITDLTNNVTTGNYTLSDVNGNKSLAITINNHTDNFQVDTLTENYLYLSEEIPNAPYTYNGSSYTAAKEVFTLNLKCSCQ